MNTDLTVFLGGGFGEEGFTDFFFWEVLCERLAGGGEGGRDEVAGGGGAGAGESAGDAGGAGERRGAGGGEQRAARSRGVPAAAAEVTPAWEELSEQWSIFEFFGFIF
jgi:hypothetical protein